MSVRNLYIYSSSDCNIPVDLILGTINSKADVSNRNARPKQIVMSFYGTNHQGHREKVNYKSFNT